MLTIRFNRTGKKNRVSYRLVLQEKTKVPGKRHIEILGSHDPHTKTTILRKDRILHWLAQGTQTSDVVHNLLLREGVIEGTKIPRKMPRPVVKEVAEAEPVEAKVEEVVEPATEEVAAEAEPAEVKEEAVAIEELVVEEVKEVVEEVVTEAPVVEEAAEAVAEEAV